MPHPTTALAFLLILLLPPAISSSLGADTPAPPKPANAEYPNFNNGESNPKDPGIEWVQAIAVTAPAYGADVKGNVTVTFRAPGMTKAKALCWQQPTTAAPSPWGHDAEVAADISLDADGGGTFVFPADQFPGGPLTLRIHTRDDGKKQDLCQLQLYNKGGVAWNQGIPKTDPPAAKGMKLAFSDDFDGPLSISRDGKDAKYQAHKTGGGDFSGWPFSNPDGENNPFSQVGTFLRIRASKKPGTKGSTGIISSANEQGGGFFASAPCYFECRFMAQSAPGTWPAFWLLTKGCLDKSRPKDGGTDELDIIEAYGGAGKGNPNFPDYAIVTHYWNAKGPDGKPKKADHVDVKMTAMGGKSSWSTTFHTYAVKITETDTIYYFDDMEVLRHPSGQLSKTEPLWFLIDYAIGGISGWKIDLARYDNVSDMWVDYVRVYQGEKK
jgi:hypothetical protein